MFKVRGLDVGIGRSVGKPPAEFKRVLWSPVQTGDRIEPLDQDHLSTGICWGLLFGKFSLDRLQTEHFAMRTLIALFLAALNCVAAAAAESGKTTVIIKGNPRFEQRAYFAYVHIRDSGRSYRFWWPSDSHIALSTRLLDTNQVYTFTLDQGPDPRDTPTLRRIKLGETSVYDVDAPVSLTTNPQFVQEGTSIKLVLSDSNRTYKTSWANTKPDIQFVPVSVDTNRTYTFTIRMEPFEEFRFPELHRIESEGRTIYDIEVCHVHKVKMEHKEVPIYGLLSKTPNAPSDDEEKRLFPNYREYIGGLCTGPRAGWIYVCPNCKEAFAKWKQGK